MNLKSILIKFIADVKFRPIYWITMIFAIIAAFLVTGMDAQLRGMGFFLWIISNGYLLIHFYKDKNIPMILLFIAYECFNIIGVLNNWIYL